MAIEFVTDPKIPWHEFKKSKLLRFDRYYKEVFVTEHYLISDISGHIPGVLWAFEWEGYAQFMRYAPNNPQLLALVGKEFDVSISDEYGIEYPEFRRDEYQDRYPAS